MKSLTHFLVLLSTFLSIDSYAANKESTLDLGRYHEYRLINTVAIDNTYVANADFMVVNPILIIIKEGIKKVIRAMDLVMQRFQKQFLRIQVATEELKNQMSKLKLDEINHWVNEKKEIFDKYYAELWTIKAKIDQIQSIKNAIASQAQLITRFTQIFTNFRNDEYFSQDELDLINEVYMGMLSENVDVITSINLLITDSRLQMQDGERLQLIEESLDKIERVSADFNDFTSYITSISLGRAKENGELDLMKSYYGIQ